MALKLKSPSNKIIARVREQEVLKHLLQSKKAEFLAIYGRRRIGKTYLIRNFFTEHSCIYLHVTGIQNGKLKEQLKQFAKQIGITFYNGASIGPYRSWMDAFEELTKAIQQTRSKKSMVLFFDEFPWMATKRSGLLSALEYYWNRYWSHEPSIKLIICGSSASWVIDKIINNKGGLYNRVTRTMRLAPFSLHETNAFLKEQGIELNQQQILELYMVLGGIPQYLSLVTPGLSAQQCIDTLCFQRDGDLVDEFKKLYASLFEDVDAYMSLIRIIADHHFGIGQGSLIKKSGMSEGGRVVKRLRDLEEAGFIIGFLQHGNQKKGMYYKVIDEYTLFYLHWIEPFLSSIKKQDPSSGYWLSKSRTPNWKSWAGYAFEAVCTKHLPQIRQALKIDPGAEAGSWRYVSKDEETGSGAQIDLLFDRPDNAITLCEIKHSNQPFIIDKEYADDLIKKMATYRKHTRTTKQLFLAMITSGGLKWSKYSAKIVSQQANLDDLFRF